GRFDVYLKDLGSLGLYGYCAPEYRVPGLRQVASGYCVLDNDFARKQYGENPMVSLRVTAAHEFFHAIQFGYDFREDPWLLESTATWMEERVADGADDNRRYLPYGQLTRPGTSLDLYDPSGFNQYGNWTFWEYLGGRFGNDVVRAVWRQAGAYVGAPDRYSVAALRRVLAEHGGVAPVFAAYASAATAPAHYFEEGAAWPATASRSLRLGADDRRARASMRINHLAARTIDVRPKASLRARRWRLQITVNAPAAKTGPAAHLQVWRRDGTVTARPIRLDADGAGRERVRFDSRRVRRVTITLANASTRYRCGHGGMTFACEGRPRDQRLGFDVAVRVVRR
ncbi:MAG TPA: MXAN_6640 family putative metalloprotease, partial [Nocardioides sp.]|nr:MXAN_6640 family putative metalloprotease [Nocardioides sp.]